MTGRTTAIVSLLTLLLGSGVGGIKFVKPALDEQHKLEAQKRDLTHQNDALNNEVADLRAKLNSMAMSSISYFDLSPYGSGGGRDDKRRVMEAKTVETLASLTEIFNDNHIRVKVITPTGETQGLNKPVPTPPPPSLAPGQSPTPMGTPTPAQATPTPVPGATTPPPPISLTHKTFTVDLEGEYPDFVKALNEIQGLPRAISINAYKLKLVQDDKAGAAPPKPADDGVVPSASLLQLSFDMSITFLMDAGGVLMTPPPMPSATPPHAAGLVAELGDWLCPAAEAAEARPRPAVRPPNAIRGVRWEAGALHFQTALGSTPHYKVVGARPGYMVLQFDRTVTAAPLVLDAHAPGVRQVIALPAPTDPLATHVAITAAPGARLRLGLTPSRQLVVFVDQGPVAAMPTQAVTTMPTHPVATLPAHPVPAAAKPAAGAKPAPVAGKPAPVAAKPAPTAAKPAPIAAKPAPIAAKPAPVVAIMPPHHTPATAPQGPATVVPAPTDAMKIVVKPEAAKPQAPWEHETDHVTPEAARAWERDRLKAMSAEAGVGLHGAPAPRPRGREGVVTTTSVVSAPVPVTTMATTTQTVVAMPLPDDIPHHRVAAANQIAAAPVPAAQPAPVTRPAPVAHPAPHVAVAPAPTPGPQDGLTRLDGVRIEGSDLVIETHGATPTFKVLGGNKHLLLLSVDHMPLASTGHLIRVNHAGIKQVRAALFDNRLPVSHLAIDTDGSVRLQPVADATGAIRLHISGPGAPKLAQTYGISNTADVTTSAITMTNDARVTQPGRQPVAHPKPQTRMTKLPPARKPVVAAKPRPKPPAPKPIAPVAAKPVQPVAAKPGNPTATPTPMAVPHGTQPKAAPQGMGSPAPKASPNAFENRQLQQRSINSYRFPIDRDRQTGRVNPFKPIHKPTMPPGLPGVPGAPGLPAVPPAPGAAPGAPGAVAPGYTLKAVMIGGGAAPTALISVGGKALMVGLNQTLPGNARVKSIQTDYVILSANGQDIRLHLKR